MKLIKKYLKVVREIYEYFDYVAGEKILPIEDYTEFDWYYSENERNIYFKSTEDIDYFSEIGTIYYGQYDKLDMVMFEIQDDVLLIFDGKNEVYIDE